MLRSRRFYLSLLGAVACSATAADTTCSILEAASLSVRKLSFIGLAITASVFDVTAVCCVGVFSTQYAWKRDGLIKEPRTGRRILAGTCSSVSMVALVISLASIITIKKRLNEVTAATSHAVIGAWDGYIAVHIIIWIFTCLSQLVLYSSPLWSTTKRATSRSASDSMPRDSVMSEVRNSNQTANLYMLEPTQPASPLAALPSPTFSTRSSQSLKSWRESLHQVVRPVTSRTKLINRPSFNRDTRSIYSYSDGGHSVDNASQSDGFEAWDTSSVDPQARDVVMQSAPSRGTVLEPIPGSRPPSPARALDGPFPLESDESEPRALSPPPKMLPDTSRPPSPAVSEAHIHPLFRTESPTPPPAATPGTSIIASPLANQMITCPPRPYSRMRSNSRAASPSPLMHSQSLYESARSPSPPSRELTPPIPDFVLNSSPRSSTSGANGRRKANLPPENSR